MWEGGHDDETKSPLTLKLLKIIDIDILNKMEKLGEEFQRNTIDQLTRPESIQSYLHNT